jgi:DNA-binding beta-propeller fold protein YncE
MKSIGLALIALCAFASSLSAQIPPSYQISLPGNPFGVVVSRDQKWVFVSLPMGPKKGAIAVLQSTNGKVQFVRTVPTDHPLLGIVLTHNGDTLIAAAQDRVVFFDTKKLETAESDPAFQWVSDGPRAASVNVNVTADDKTLFVSDEADATITVIDLDRIRSPDRDSGANIKKADAEDGAPDAVIGRIPVGIAPVALTFSKDQRWLFATSEAAPPDWGWPRVLNREGGTGKITEGAVIVIDVAKARLNPLDSVVARVPAGGSPVRSVLSPDGSRLFVSARNSNAILVFDTADLVGNPNKAKPIKIPVGNNPVPVVLVENGKLALVGNSNRFSANAAMNSTLTVLDTSLIGTQKNPEIGQIPCGAFPREFSLSADGKTLFLTNFRSGTLQVMDVSRLMEIMKKTGP